MTVIEWIFANAQSGDWLRGTEDCWLINIDSKDDSIYLNSLTTGEGTGWIYKDGQRFDCLRHFPSGLTSPVIYRMRVEHWAEDYHYPMMEVLKIIRYADHKPKRTAKEIADFHDKQVRELKEFLGE